MLCLLAFLISCAASVWIVTDPAIPVDQERGCLAFMWANRRDIPPYVNDVDMDVLFFVNCNNSKIFTACYSNTYDGYLPSEGKAKGLPALKGPQQPGLQWQLGERHEPEVVM